MDWIMNNVAVLLILTAVTGSILSLLWPIVTKCWSGTLNARVLYGMLKCVMLGYMIPIAYGAMQMQFILYGGCGGYLLMETRVTMYIFRILLLVWVSGMCIALFWQIQRFMELRSICKGCMQAMQWKRALLQRLCAELHIQRKVELYQGYGVQVPFITGMIRTRIYLPMEEFSTKELEVILRHELCHYKQGDMFWKPAISMVCCIFWFNPLVRGTWHQMKRWAEASCDSRCCEQWIGAKQYFLFLYKMNENVEQKAPDMASAWLEDNNELKWRIQCIKNRTRTRMKTWAAVGVFAVTIMCCGGSAYAAHAGVEAVYGRVYQKTVHDTEVEIAAPIELNFVEVTAEEAFKGLEIVEMPDDSSRVKSAGKIDWTVTNGYGVKSKGFYKKEGTQIQGYVSIDPSDKKVRVGIVKPNGCVDYVSGTESIFFSFDVEESGTYQLYISNAGRTKTSVAGAYSK